MFSPMKRFIDHQARLDRLGTPLQSSIATIFQSTGETGAQAKNCLNGTWLGHPAHPAITDVPIEAGPAPRCSMRWHSSAEITQ